MAANYVLLETITVGEAGASSVTFNNIPQSGYTDLKVVYSVRTTGGSGQWMNLSLSFNGLTTNWSNKYLYGTGSAAGSNGTSTNFYAAGVGNPSTTTANTFSSGELYVPNFAGSNAKSVSYDTITENNGTSALIQLGAALWNSTAALTSLTIAPESGVGNFAQYSTFSLYGLAAVGATPVIAPYASGGDIIQTDGTYWYHAFLSSGTFTPAKGLSCDVLVVAGGGGAGTGAGGAGGLLALTSQSLASNTAQTVTVGAGGTRIAMNASGITAGNGGNSSFGSISGTVYGGGGGGANAVNGANGGSGGGSGAGSGTYSGGTGTSGQGYAGTGNTIKTVPYSGGSGGGATTAGNAATSSVGGAGGTGYYSAFTDAAGALLSVGQLSSGHYYFAGGGGGSINYVGYTGGAGGLGGGGNGISGGTGGGGNGAPNTGGGGGGTGDNGDSGTYYGGKGGSGIVIVRYAI